MDRPPGWARPAEAVRFARVDCRLSGGLVRSDGGGLAAGDRASPRRDWRGLGSRARAVAQRGVGEGHPSGGARPRGRRRRVPGRRGCRAGRRRDVTALGRPAGGDRRRAPGRPPRAVSRSPRRDDRSFPSGRASDAWLGGRRAVAEAVRAGVALEVLFSGGARSGPLAELSAAASGAGVPVGIRPVEELDRLAADHQGVVARVALPRELGEAELRDFPFGPDAVVVVLDGVTDPQNLGAAARSAEAAGVAMLVSRERRAAPVTPAAVRASAGALLHLPMARVTNLTRALIALQSRGFPVVGLDEDAPRSILDEPAPDGPLALVLGAEGSGISRLVREHCDLLVALPMRGKVQSLNASAALAAALFAY